MQPPTFSDYDETRVAARLPSTVCAEKCPIVRGRGATTDDNGGRGTALPSRDRAGRYVFRDRRAVFVQPSAAFDRGPVDRPQPPAAPPPAPRATATSASS